MPVTLAETRAINGIANVLYSFLPGSGNRSWRGHVTFGSVAATLGLGHYWPGGSKLPAIITLLELTLQHQRPKFEALLVEIVRKGIAYRQKNREPVTANEIEQLAGFAHDLGVKVPLLWDEKFRESLSHTPAERARHNADLLAQQERAKITAANERSVALRKLRDAFFALHADMDRQRAGHALEDLLNELFDAYDLAPRGRFRLTGEEIDGSFELDHETYLVEAKWENKALSEAPLMVFREKVMSKSRFTRGVLIAVNDVTMDAKEAIYRGKQPTFFVVTGHDLTMLLLEAIDLVTFLRVRARLLGEGRVFVPFQEVVARA